jgi:hypothetical protein
MPKPQTRQQLKDYSLRQLGAPVIDVNVDDSQIEDCLDDALQFFAEYHFDGVELAYPKHLITQIDIDNNYLDMDEIDSNIITVNRLFNISTSTINMFDVQYQMALNDFFGSFTPGSLANYSITKSNLEMLQDILNPEKNIRFSKVTNKMYGDFNWSDELNVGDYLVMEVYRLLDPETYPEIYNDRLLKKYFVALVKRQWGNNLSKFEGIQLPGGVQFNGQRILDEAREAIDKIEEEVQDKYELPPDFSVG